MSSSPVSAMKLKGWHGNSESSEWPWPFDRRGQTSPQLWQREMRAMLEAIILCLSSMVTTFSVQGHRKLRRTIGQRWGTPWINGWSISRPKVNIISSMNITVNDPALASLHSIFFFHLQKILKNIIENCALVEWIRSLIRRPIGQSSPVHFLQVRTAPGLLRRAIFFPVFFSKSWKKLISLEMRLLTDDTTPLSHPLVLAKSPPSNPKFEANLEAPNVT